MLDIFQNILGWTSVVFYILITVFNSMKFTRYAAFASAANDIIWSILMGWWPKLILNLSVGAINTYRYLKDFTKTGAYLLNGFAGIVGIGILYIIYFAVKTYFEHPTLSVALQFADLGFIVLALSMTSLRKYRWLMLISGFVGMAGYFANPQMVIIKAMVICIMTYKLFTSRHHKEEESVSQTAE